jgi:hypothetical protein
MPPELHSRLLEALESAFPNPSGFDTFLHRALGRDLDSFAPRSLARPDLYSQVIVGVSALGRMWDFLARLRVERKDNAKVQGVWQRFSADTGSADGDAFKVCLLNQMEPFWNRSGLRRHVQELLTGRGTRVLVVNGPGRSGRTFTRWYIGHAAQFHNARPFYLDMKGKTGASPGDIGRLIALWYQWPPETLPPRHAQASQWAEEIAVWVAGRAASAPPGDRVVLVFDNTCAPGLLTETKELLVNLADQAAGEDRLRVTLLAHADPYTSDARRMAAFEEIAPPSKTDVYSFLAVYAAHKGYDVAPDALSAVASRTWDPLAAATGSVQMDDLVEAVKQAMSLLDRAVAAAAGGDPAVPGPGPGG